MKLPPGFEYQPGFLPEPDASALLTQLWDQAAWRQQKIFLFGQWRPEPRLAAWYADSGVRYRYSGLDLEPEPWLPGLSALRRRLQSATEMTFNSVLLNAYRDGKDSMGWHADDEPELGPSPNIASISLGATRRFRIRPRGGGSSMGLDLDAGSLVLMTGSSQAKWQHCVPKTARPVALRLNLTFRNVLPT